VYEKVLISLDGSKESECIIEHVRILSEGNAIPKLVLLRVVEPFPVATLPYVGDDAARVAQVKLKKAAEEYLSYVADQFRTHCRAAEVVVLEGNPANEILEYAKKHDVDLIAMSTHGASGVARWAIGSVARKVLDHWPGAMLTATPESCRP
jgi:nucleotide-binding universal stress UspA family protein